MEKPIAHLSPSCLSTYNYCPAEFYRRYVLKLIEPPSFEREFGTAVHKGIEAHYRNQDYEMAFLMCWRLAQKECRSAGIIVPDWLTVRGLELVEMVRNLAIPGEPERYIGVIDPNIPLPFIGYVDLWAEDHIVDFKTTGFGWTQTKADAQIFQPAIYSQAHAEVYGSIPKFTFVVLPRNGGPVQLFDATRTPDQIIAAFDRAREIYDLIEAQVFACLCARHTVAAQPGASSKCAR